MEGVVFDYYMCGDKDMTVKERCIVEQRQAKPCEWGRQATQFGYVAIREGGGQGGDVCTPCHGVVAVTNLLAVWSLILQLVPSRGRRAEEDLREHGRSRE